jgi:hypothetical protein
MRTRKLLLCVVLSALACSEGGSSGGSGGGEEPGAGSDATLPLDVSSDGRHLQGDNDEWWLVTGDAAWSLLVALNEAEAEHYFEDRRARGFNTVLVSLIDRSGPANANGDPPFLTANDFTTPNEAYFAHVDRILDRAAAKNMLVALAPAYLGDDCGSDGWCQQILAQPVSAMESYGHFLGDRYRDRTNILWVHGGDTRASEHGVNSRVNALANAIMDRAPAHLHTAHCSRHESGIECYDQPWLDVNTVHSSCGESLPEVREARARRPAQVFFHIEGNYEGAGPDLGCLIDQYAWSVLGGGVGHVFGNTPLWHFSDGWEGELDSDGSQAMAHLEDLFESRAWFRLRPELDDDVLVSGGGDGTAAAMTSGRETVMIYTDSPRTVVVDIGDLAGTRVQAWFFDPADGSSIDFGIEIPGLFDEEAYDLPRRGVLVIDDADALLAAPGTAPY